MKKISVMAAVFAVGAFLAVHAWAEDAAAVKERVYPKLRDLKCAGMTLDKCSCAESRVMKSYIDALIDTGVKDDDIIYYTGKRFSPAVIVDTTVRDTVEKRVVKELGDNHPFILVEPVSFDFGKLSKRSGPASHLFKVKNAGKAPLIISKLKVSCTCTAANIIVDKNKGPALSAKNFQRSGAVSLAPGQTAELEVILDLADRAMTIGPVTRIVTVTSNDALYPETTVVVKAVVEP